MTAPLPLAYRPLQIQSMAPPRLPTIPTVLKTLESFMKECSSDHAFKHQSSQLNRLYSVLKWELEHKQQLSAPLYPVIEQVKTDQVDKKSKKKKHSKEQDGNLKRKIEQVEESHSSSKSKKKKKKTQ